jgi:hypothetical protein
MGVFEYRSTYLQISTMPEFVVSVIVAHFCQ